MDKLDRLGTQLKYFSQKKDVIVIKNMLVNVQNRYQRVGTRCNEKTRELEAGLKIAKQVNYLPFSLSDSLLILQLYNLFLVHTETPQDCICPYFCSPACSHRKEKVIFSIVCMTY